MIGKSLLTTRPPPGDLQLQGEAISEKGKILGGMASNVTCLAGFISFWVTFLCATPGII